METGNFSLKNKKSIWIVWAVIAIIIAWAVNSDSEPNTTPALTQSKSANAVVKVPTDSTIPGSGTFEVNKEVRPGIYKSYGNVSYWARLSEFSGDNGSIIANNIPHGSDIVEITASDKGFETRGAGEWRLVDGSYLPQKMAQFGEGTYIVGKEIEPGMYKSDGAVTYWARLRDFSGKGIIANGIPKGPAIVEIKSTDKGFTTRGGNWVKVN